MARQMIEIAKSPELAARLGQNARRNIEQNFSRERSFNSLWSIIETAISANRRESRNNQPGRSVSENGNVR
jgi:glycosyltransferase involved in cell wall biosynthesis